MIPFQKITIGRLGLVPAICALGGLSYLAAAHDTFPGDVGAIERFQAHRSAWLDDAAVAATTLANVSVAISSTVAISFVLLAFQRKADALIVLLVLLPQGIALAIKELVGRDRPDFSLLVSLPHNPAFPSGHAVHAFLLFGILMVIVAGMIKPLWLKVTIQTVLGLMILACGASRVYLGVHWPSDVVGGYLRGCLRSQGPGE